MTRDSGKDHERIWLQSYEDTEALGEDRLWCEDKVWPNDPEDHEPTEYVRADLFAALEADLDAVTTYAAVLEAERDNARNDEWLAAISAVQFMSANWWQDCRSEVERNALQAVTEDVISALRSVGPTEYLDVQWKGAEAAMAAEEKAERLQRELSETEALREEGTAKITDLTLALSTARRTALLEAAEVVEALYPQLIIGELPCPDGDTVAAALRAKAEEA